RPFSHLPDLPARSRVPWLRKCPHAALKRLPVPSVRRPLVLVAEDHDDTRTMLRMLLTIHGYDVADYAEGEAALAAAIRLRPDLAVVDGHLCGLDGFGVTRKIRARADLQRLPIIFVSGWSGPEHEERARGAGCDHYLLKPVDLDRLLELIR